jgi:TetR/AcrR family transcriptional regulator, transcriptional repressor for nem operon
MGHTTHSGEIRNGLSNPENWYRGGVENEGRDRPKLTPKGERTRNRIVEAAAQLIYERGVAGTTLDDIRSKAGVSGSQLSHYFAGKDELVQAVIGYQAETITGNQRQADLGSPGGLRAWRDTVIAQADSSQGTGGCPLGSLAGQLAETDTQARALIAAGFGHWSAAISDGLRRLHDTGHLPKGPTRMTSLSPCSPHSKAASSSPRSNATPVPSKPLSTPSSNSPASATRTRRQTARSPRP